METSLKTGFAQIFSCCPKKLSCPNFGGAAAPLAPPAGTPMDVKWRKIKDFTGKVIDPEKTGNGDITLYLSRFEDDGKKRSSVDHDKRQSLKKETKVRVQGRFYEALDLHYYHSYRNTHPERRMAICEEIERKIVIDDVTLTRFREYLNLEEILNTWVVWKLHILVNFQFTDVLINSINQSIF